MKMLFLTVFHDLFNLTLSSNAADLSHIKHNPPSLPGGLLSGAVFSSSVLCDLADCSVYQGTFAMCQIACMYSQSVFSSKLTIWEWTKPN